MLEEQAVPLLQPCAICGRTFNPEVLVGSHVSRPVCLRVFAQARHEGVCKKNNENAKKRRKFDSSKQRLDHVPIEIKNKVASSPSSKQQTVSDLVIT